MFDLNHEFFRPLWIRVTVTAVTLGWSVVEFLTAAPFWGILFGAAGVWCGWSFFVRGAGKSEQAGVDPGD